MTAMGWLISGMGTCGAFESARRRLGFTRERT